MYKIVISSYACSPNLGSEPGVGWNWFIHLSKYCELYVITEGEFRPQIEEWMQEHGYEAIQSLSLSCVESSGWHPLTKHGGQGRVFFFWNPVSPEVRRMCWNNGDWRFYYYYEKWQRKTADIARGIVKELHSCPVQDNSIVLHKIKGVGPDGFSLPIGEGWGGSPVPDGSLPLEGEVPVGGRGSALLLHQLNMIGFREPGYLWQVSKETGIPFVWGPIGGMKQFPLAYAKGGGLKMRLFAMLKNTINIWQIKHGRRVKEALHQASLLISSIPDSYNAIKKYHGLESVIIPETGCFVDEFIEQNSSYITHHSSKVPDGFPRPMGERVRERGRKGRGGAYSSLSTLHSSLSEDSSFFILHSSFKLNLLWVGKFDFRKRLDIALRTIASLCKLNISLTVFGEGNRDQVHEIKALIKQLNIDDKVTLMGNQPNDVAKAYMRKSDVFFFTSVNEDTSTVVLEAISNNLPVVCFDACGMAAVIDSSVGIKIPLSNPSQSVKDFSEKIEYLYNHPEELQRMSDNCRKRAEEFSWDNKAKQMVSLYETLFL